MRDEHLEQEDREWLMALLPKSQHGKIDSILDYFWSCLDSNNIGAIAVTGARPVVERVTAYGLAIGVDANGEAAEIRFPYGDGQITEWS